MQRLRDAIPPEERERKSRGILDQLTSLPVYRNADQILVIDSGKITQRGTHDTLMQENGTYRSFVESRREAASWRL